MIIEQEANKVDCFLNSVVLEEGLTTTHLGVFPVAVEKGELVLRQSQLEVTLPMAPAVLVERLRFSSLWVGHTMAIWLLRSLQCYDLALMACVNTFLDSRAGAPFNRRIEDISRWTIHGQTSGRGA